MTDFKTNWAFSEKYMPQIKQILAKHAGKFLLIQVANMEEDLTQAFDLDVIAGKKTHVSVRIRRASIKFRDITIRAYNKGHKTEIHKLREGFGDWYLYAWVGDNQKIVEYALIDIHAARDLFMKEKPVIPNTDNATGFVNYSFDELAQVGALIAYEKRTT